MPGHERNFGARQKLFYFLQKLQPRHVGHHHIGEHHVDGLLLEQCQRGLPAFRFQADKSESLADRDAEFADTLLVVDDQQANAKVFSVPWATHSAFPNVLDTTSINCCTRNGFSTQGAPVCAQSGHGFLVGNISRNKDDSRRQIGAVCGHPGMHLTSVHPAGRAHVRHHPQKCAVFQQAEGIHARLAADHGISAALESGLDVCHDGGLIFDQQHGQRMGSQGWEAHGCFTPAATPNDAVWDAAGRRTMNVAPGLASVVVTKNLAPMLLQNAVANAEAEAGAFADLFGGEERVENLIRMGDSVAVVAERNFDRVARLGRHDLDARGTADFVHGIVGIVQNVEKDLLQLVRVAHHLGQSLVEMFHDIDAVAVEVIGPQLDRPAQNRVQLHGVALRRHLAGKAEQVLHDLLGALGFLQDHAHILAGRLGQIGILHQQVGKSQNRGQRVVHFMGDAGDQIGRPPPSSRRAPICRAKRRNL